MVLIIQSHSIQEFNIMSVEIFENTLIKLITRQGSDASRKLITLTSGELGFTTDTERLFVGNGSDTGGILVGNKYKGSDSSIINLSPSEIGDTGFETSTNKYYVLESGNGSIIGNWRAVASKATVEGSSPIILNVDEELELQVQSPLYIESNTLKISLSATTPLDSNDIVDIIYPINSIFFTLADINPNTYFTATTWVQVSQGKFLAGVGTGTDMNSVTRTLTAGNNYGEYSHTLIEAELPSHTHEGYTVVYGHGTGDQDVSDDVQWNADINGERIMRHENSGHTSVTITSPVYGQRHRDGQPVLNNVGSDTTHNVTNPSYALYVWRRTA
jgi:hypothetical protein